MVRNSFKFLLSEKSVDNQIMPFVHEEVEEALVRSFGNFHSVMAEGVLFIPSKDKEFLADDFILYTVAFENTKLLIDKLLVIIVEAAERLQQAVVYLELPNNEVMFIETGK